MSKVGLYDVFCLEFFLEIGTTLAFFQIGEIVSVFSAMLHMFVMYCTAFVPNYLRYQMLMSFGPVWLLFLAHLIASVVIVLQCRRSASVYLSIMLLSLFCSCIKVFQK